MTRHMIFRQLAIVLLTALAWAVPAAMAADGQMRDLLTAYLEEQTAGMAGEVDVNVTMPRVAMTACRRPQPFLPGRKPRMIGHITVGVRCPGNRPSTRYFQANVSVITPYYVAARALAPGDMVAASDLKRESGDISRLSSNITTDASSLIGMAAVRRVAPGMPLTRNMVKQPTAIKRGEQVRVVARGAGFSITTDGKALNSAPIGGRVRVSTRQGQIVTGVSSDQSTVTLRR